jgi:hypothetical protein
MLGLHNDVYKHGINDQKMFRMHNDLPHFQNWETRSDKKMLDLHNNVHKTDINDQKLFGLHSVFAILSKLGGKV